jgi:hypothetical protein
MSVFVAKIAKKCAKTVKFAKPQKVGKLWKKLLAVDAIRIDLKFHVTRN